MRSTGRRIKFDRRWLAHLYVLCKGRDSCRRRRDSPLGLTALIDSHRDLFPEKHSSDSCSTATAPLLAPTLAPQHLLWIFSWLAVGQRRRFIPKANLYPTRFLLDRAV